MINNLNYSTYITNSTNVTKFDNKFKSKQKIEESSINNNQKNGRVDSKTSSNINKENISIDGVNKKLSKGSKSEDLSKLENISSDINEANEYIENIKDVLDEILKRFVVTQKISTGDELTKEEQEFRNTRGIIVQGSFMTPKKHCYETYSKNLTESNYSNKLDIRK